ncbi:hypothetical protein [Radicibacter daui]|uniref:hypothetical protein n=1 Tax=Radicibacter daui TaxID=3064829 RepID=UPI004046C926
MSMQDSENSSQKKAIESLGQVFFAQSTSVTTPEPGPNERSRALKVQLPDFSDEIAKAESKQKEAEFRFQEMSDLCGRYREMMDYPFVKARHESTVENDVKLLEVILEQTGAKITELHLGFSGIIIQFEELLIEWKNYRGSIDELRNGPKKTNLKKALFKKRREHTDVIIVPFFSKTDEVFAYIKQRFDFIMKKYEKYEVSFLLYKEITEIKKKIDDINLSYQIFISGDLPIRGEEVDITCGDIVEFYNSKFGDEEVVIQYINGVSSVDELKLILENIKKLNVMIKIYEANVIKKEREIEELGKLKEDILIKLEHITSVYHNSRSGSLTARGVRVNVLFDNVNEYYNTEFGDRDQLIQDIKKAEFTERLKPIFRSINQLDDLIKQYENDVQQKEDAVARLVKIKKELSRSIKLLELRMSEVKFPRFQYKIEDLYLQIEIINNLISDFKYDIAGEQIKRTRLTIDHYDEYIEKLAYYALVERSRTSTCRLLAGDMIREQDEDLSVMLERLEDKYQRQCAVSRDKWLTRLGIAGENINGSVNNHYTTFNNSVPVGTAVSVYNVEDTENGAIAICNQLFTTVVWYHRIHATVVSQGYSYHRYWNNGGQALYSPNVQQDGFDTADLDNTYQRMRTEMIERVLLVIRLHGREM